MPQTTATVFSWAITLNGSPIADFGGIRFSFAVSGLAISGCCSTQLEFDVYDPTNFYGDMLLDGAEVTVSCPELFFTSQTYFCDSISTSKKICRFVCYDRICRTDRPLDISGILFGEDDTVSADGVLSAVRSQCGFSSYGSSGNGLEYIKFSESQLENITCRRALELVSEALAGVWVCGDGSTLYLACLGGGDFGDYAYCEDYSEIDFQGRTKITTLEMTNSETGEVYSFGGEENGTVITINSPFASPELGLTVWERIGNYVYTAWHCDKADVTYDSTLKNMSSLIFRRADVEGDKLFATTTEFAADSTGVYFSGGAAAYNEWNYEDYTQRQLNERVQIGKTVGNTQVTKDGICFVNKNVKSSVGRSAYTTDVEKYAFSVGEKGVTVYDGDMVSAGIFESAEKIDDNTVIVTYPDFKIKYTKTGNGSKASLKKEIIREGDENG